MRSTGQPDRSELYWEALGKPEPARGELVVASGGLCAPVSPVYELYTFSIPRLDQRPVREALPGFEVRRDTP